MGGSRRPVGPGPGSYRLLAWVARLGVAGVEPARLVLGLSQAVAYSHVARLVRAQLLWRVGVKDGGGGVVAVTRAGARVARERGADGVVAARPNAPSTARHARAVSWVAAAVELRGWEWLGPAQLAAGSGWRVQREDGARHAPDLGLVRDGSRTAIEVELSAKAPRRLAVILGGYRALIDRGDLSGVSYVVDRRNVAALVRRQADAAVLGADLHVGPLAPLVDEARTLGAQLRARETSHAGGQPASQLALRSDSVQSEEG